MKKMIFIVVSAFFVLSACSSGNEDTVDGASETENSNETYTIRVPLLGSDTNFVNESYNEFKDAIEEKTDGQIEVEIYGNGTMAAAEEQQLDLVTEGNAELTSVASGIITNHAGVNSFGIFDVPFLFDTDEKMANYLDSELMQEIFSDLEEVRNVNVIGAYDMKGYNMFNNVRPIEEPEDMDGLKLRTSPIDLQIDLLNELGANATPLSYSETFTSLQQGTLDGIHIATALGWTDNFYEVSDYLTLTRHVGLVHTVMVNEEFHSNLPENLQGTLDEELENLISILRKNAEETNDEALVEMESSGVEITELTEEQFEVFRNNSENTTEKAIELVGEEVYDRSLEVINN